MNTLNKLNLLYLLSLFCYTSFSYAQNTCETILSNALALPTAICDGEFADYLVTVENPAVDGELNWYNANTNELISNPQKVFLYANESSCSIVIETIM